MNPKTNYQTNFSQINKLSLDKVFLPQSLYRNDFIEVLNLPIRLENILKNGDIENIGQLCDISDKELLQVRNIGRKSVAYLMEVRKKIKNNFGELADQRPRTEPARIIPQQINIPNNKLISTLLERCGSEKSKDVIIRRYGLITGDSQTLEEIGETFGVTRERIRQLQVKALNKMKHPSTIVRQPIMDLIEKVLYRNGAILSAEEADIEIPKALGGISDDGSSILDLLCDLGWIQSTRIGDILIYSPSFNSASLEKISNKILTLVKSEGVGIDNIYISQNVSDFRKIKNPLFDAQKFILRYCQLDPRIEEIGDTPDQPDIIVRHYTSGHFVKKGWVTLMTRVLEEEQMPLHYTEIANRVNDILGNPSKQLDVRRAHSILIQEKTFAHSGIHGTYGLTSWGLRKETTSELVDECLKKAGFPLHWKQIYNYVSKYKDSKPGSIVSILESRPNHYQKIESGVFWFKEA